MKTLYIDSTIRDNSRTKILADYLAEKLGGEIEHLVLARTKLPELNSPTLEFRNSCCAKRDFSSPMFDFAKQFIEADNIIISAPFWDMSFPSLIKEYFETISVNHLLFEYDKDGRPVGLAKAECLYYVTTAGGPIFDDSFGYGYLRALCKGMFGIEHTHMFKAEGLDIKNADVDGIIRKSLKEIDLFFENLKTKQ